MSREGTLVTIDGRTALRFERRYRQPVERVWRAVTEPDELRRWFPSAVVGDRAVGATLLFDDDEQRAAARAAGDPTRDDGPFFHGRVVSYEPPRVFSFTWGGELLRFELSVDGDGTRLVFTQVLGHRSTSARNGAGWHACLGALDAAMGLAADDREWPAIYEDYLVRVGPPLGVPGADRSLRWERATHVTPARVAAAVHDAAEIAAWGGTERDADPHHWEIEAVEHGTVYRLTVDDVAGDPVRAAQWHALLVQLDMYLAAGRPVPADARLWTAAYAAR